MKKVINVTIIFGIISLLFVVGVKAAILFSASDVTYNGTTVQAKLEELESKVEKCPEDALCSKVKLGDYVQMTPTQTTYKIPKIATGYDSDQTINPSELKLWRVIDIRSDGTLEMISEYVSSTDVYFYGKDGYRNIIGALNLIASQYGNSSYTIGSRHMGYHGQTATITYDARFQGTTPWSYYYSEGEKYGEGDSMSTADTNASTGLVSKALGTLVANRVGTTTATSYWIASRSRSYLVNSFCYYYGEYINTSGNLSLYDLFRYNSGEGWTHHSAKFPVRPILILKSDITTFTGSGTRSSPWILS